MKVIKFRAWDSENRQMLDVQELNFEDCFYGGEMQIKTTMYNDYFDYREMPLMQYTGLKDKNGVEIYEGDIVKIHKHSYYHGFKQEEIGEIKFIDGAFGFYREKSKNEYYFNNLATENAYGELEYYEVIGNIYDNPELLKAGD